MGTAGAAAWFAHGAFTEARRQADTAQEALIAADRPWIKVVGLSDVHVNVGVGAVVVFARVAVKNIGRSPAQHTYLDTALLADSSLDEQNARAALVCRDAEKAGYPPQEQLVFPDDAPTLSDVATIRIGTIKEERDRRLRQDFEMADRIIPDETAEDRLRARVAQPLRAGLTIVGCVTYAVSARRVVGQTAFVFGLDHACGEGPWVVCSFDMTAPGEYEGSAVAVHPAVGGAFAR